ncbi:hypothetical protein BDV34DRAFT_217934 [Aspergillus parasiticus]|uniref:Uncharacterized protein n=1 Tax=Aspergillus parasiticus TaxID=5067 RepID=A0A5N6D3E1_ASPPA|nr:hypothetical protein BDV34DRAFT_217934 [Aspergillus parasiticus]
MVTVTIKHENYHFPPVVLLRKMHYCIRNHLTRPWLNSMEPNLNVMAWGSSQSGRPMRLAAWTARRLTLGIATSCIIHLFRLSSNFRRSYTFVA